LAWARNLKVPLPVVNARKPKNQAPDMATLAVLAGHPQHVAGAIIVPGTAGHEQEVHRRFIYWMPASLTGSSGLAASSTIIRSALRHMVAGEMQIGRRRRAARQDETSSAAKGSHSSCRCRARAARPGSPASAGAPPLPSRCGNRQIGTEIEQESFWIRPSMVSSSRASFKCKPHARRSRRWSRPTVP